MAQPEYPKPLIAIVGETASGKSELAIYLAKKFRGEIISADSWVIRRGVDIGTAKPTLSERQQVPHHMIDVIDTCEDYSAAEYKVAAGKVIRDIYKRKNIPFLVGGTGLYVDSLLFNYSFLPANDPEMRQELNNLSLQKLVELASRQGLMSSKIDWRNKRRVIRLIETQGAVPSKQSLRPNTLVIGIEPSPEEVKLNIKRRVDKMISTGLENEVKDLNRRYGWKCEALKGIGYREWELYFESNQSLEDTKQRIIKNTYLLAKRQKTWFKRNKSIHWLATPVNHEEIEELVTTYLNNNLSLL